MKPFTFFLLLAVLFFTPKGYSQDTISFPIQADILKLESLIVIENGQELFNPDDATIKAVSEILRKYLPDDEKKTDQKSHQVLNYYYKNNDYIKRYILHAKTEVGVADAGQSISTSESNDLSSSPLPEISGIADGISKFLVQRTKEELKVAFFDKLQNNLKKNDLDKLMPQSYSTIEDIGDEIYNYRTYLKTLHGSFENDMKLLPSNLASYVRTSDSSKMIDDKKYLLADFLDIGQLILEEKDVHIILDTIAEISLDSLNSVHFGNDEETRKIRQGLVLSGIISNSLLKDDAAKSYISVPEFKEMVQDKTRINLYLGLIWQLISNADIQFGEKRLADYMTKEYAKPDSDELKRGFVEQFREVVEQGKNIKSYMEQLKAADIDKRPNEKSALYYGIVNSIFTVAKKILDVAKVEEDSRVYKGVKAFEASVKIPIDIKRENYSGAIVNASTLLEIGLKKSEQIIAKRLMRYGGFIAAIASSTDSDEISSIIDAYALPVGSYIQKRKASSTNIAFNAYVGLYGAKETLNIEDMQIAMAFSKEGLTKYSAGVTAPIGVAVSWSFCKHKSSFTIFPSVLDLGAVVSYRFKDSMTENLPEFTLENIIAPGIQASLGIPNSPIIVSGGWQKGPLLRQITIDDMMGAEPAIETVDASRWFVNISVDIPLFSLRAGH